LTDLTIAIAKGRLQAEALTLLAREAVEHGIRIDLFSTAEVALIVEHPNERARTVLSDETERSLRDDLA